ncbi:hypothetical protein KCG44_08000 [Pacificimonas sp. WHA3]|uniref:Uncharacterized protein n=1 Tax=Pacificimonas pallii TaxID=2827236 RepID=A0ABS6SFU6_9SPHN|nr:hypothetical protein [Pacificimonas pallii]MBV7256727.1 hypothetical protein [Pacificimonas pallii]
MGDRTDVTVEGVTACDYISETAIGLLDALHDAMTLARPGKDCSRYADDLRRLGEGSAFVAQELEAILRSSGKASVPADGKRETARHAERRARSAVS